MLRSLNMFGVKGKFGEEVTRKNMSKIKVNKDVTEAAILVSHELNILSLCSEDHLYLKRKDM